MAACWFRSVLFSRIKEEIHDRSLLQNVWSACLIASKGCPTPVVFRTAQKSANFAVMEAGNGMQRYRVLGSVTVHIAGTGLRFEHLSSVSDFSDVANA